LIERWMVEFDVRAGAVMLQPREPVDR